MNRLSSYRRQRLNAVFSSAMAPSDIGTSARADGS